MKLQLLWQQLLYLDQCQDGVQTVTLKEDTELIEEAENLCARKSTINWVRVFEKLCDENSLEKNMEMILLEELDKVLELFFSSACKQNLSPMILKGNQMVFL